MKSANLPSVRVDPELREAAESVLEEGETLSSFLEESVRAEIQRRVMHAEFIARGLSSRDQAREDGEYYSSEEVMGELESILARARES